MPTRSNNRHPTMTTKSSEEAGVRALRTMVQNTRGHKLADYVAGVRVQFWARPFVLLRYALQHLGSRLRRPSRQ